MIWFRTGNNSIGLLLTSGASGTDIFGFSSDGANNRP